MRPRVGITGRGLRALGTTSQGKDITAQKPPCLNSPGIEDGVALETVVPRAEFGPSRTQWPV